MKFSGILILIVSSVFLFNCKNKKEELSTNLVDVLDFSKDAIFDTINVPSHLKETVKDISSLNIYETGVLAKGGTTADNFENFKKLKRQASEQELLQLTYNKNNAVAVYAALGFLEDNKQYFDKIFQRFLNNKSKVHTQNGCIFDDNNPAEPLYWKYYSTLEPENIKSNRQLQKLDSLIIFTPNSPDNLLGRAFVNRNYPKTYNKYIEQLAFTHHKTSAITYLIDWYKGDYSEKLQKELIHITENDSLNQMQRRKYFIELLSFNNLGNKKIILNYLKKDTLYRDESGIMSQLENNGVFPDDH